MNRDVCEHFVPADLPCDKCEALFLAKELESPLGTVISNEVDRRAAKELRRLVAQRDALLEALKNIDKEFRKHGRQHWPEAVKARAAIAKAEEA